MKPSCYCEEAGHDVRKRCADCPKRSVRWPEPQLEEHALPAADEKIDDALIVFDILNP